MSFHQMSSVDKSRGAGEEYRGHRTKALKYRRSRSRSPQSRQAAGQNRDSISCQFCRSACKCKDGSHCMCDGGCDCVDCYRFQQVCAQCERDYRTCKCINCECPLHKVMAQECKCSKCSSKCFSCMCPDCECANCVQCSCKKCSEINQKCVGCNNPNCECRTCSH
jgi:hypothetical protein